MSTSPTDSPTPERLRAQVAERAAQLAQQETLASMAESSAESMEAS